MSVMATKKKLGNDLKIGDKFVLPRETVKILGKANVPYAIASDDKGSILTYVVELTSGPLKGKQFPVIVLGESKVDYVLKDPILNRAAAWSINYIKGLIKPKTKAKPPLIAARLPINDWNGYDQMRT